MAVEERNTQFGNNESLEEVVARLVEQVNEMKPKVDLFDPIAFRDDATYELAQWKEEVLGLIRNLEIELLSYNKRLNNLTDFIKKAETLLARLEGIDFDKLDPDKIKQAVLDALASWQKEINDDIADHKTRLKALEDLVADLNPDDIKEKVILALKTWIDSVDGDLSDLKKRVKNAEDALEKVGKDLLEAVARIDKKLGDHDGEVEKLWKKIAEIIDAGVDPEKVKELVEQLIKDWKDTVESRLGQLVDIRNDISTLKDRLDKLPPIPSAAEIVQLVLQELAGWKSQIETLTNTHTSDIAQLKLDLKTLEDKVKDLSGGGLGEAAVRALILEELAKFQLTIDQKLVLLKIELQGLITGLGARLTTVETQLANLNWNGDIQVLVNLVINSLTSWKLEIEQRITALEVKSNTAAADILSLRADLNALILQVNALVIPTPGDIDTQIQTNLTPLLADIQALQTLVNTLDGKVTANETNIATLQAGLAAIQQILDGPCPADWLAEIEQLVQGLLSAIQADILQLQQDKTALQTALNALQTQVNGLPTQADITVQIQTEITNLKTELEINIYNLDVKITALETLIVTIQSTIVQIQSSITQIDIKIQELELLILQVKETVDKLPPIPTVQEIVDQVNIILAPWQQTINAKIAALETCCTDGKTSIATLEQEIILIKEEIDQSEAMLQGIKLARLCLTGWGIVGGLETLSDDTCTVYLNKGLGVTPDGTLVKACKDLTFTHYKIFDTTPWQTWFKSFPVWEMLEWESLGLDANDPLPADVIPLTPQTGTGLDFPFIADKIVLLLPGEEQNHYLLIRRLDLVELLGNMHLLQKLMSAHDDTDSIFSEEFSLADNQPTEDDLYKASNPNLLLPVIPLHRFGFRPPDECDPDELDDPNFPVICGLDDLYDTWVPIIQDAFRQIDKAVKLVMHQYHPLLFPQLKVKMFSEKLDLLFEKWAAFRKYNEAALPNKTTKFYIQYFYDWARDLIAGYHELRDELQFLMACFCEACPDLAHAQRPYLMLGPAMRADQDGLAAPLRDTFHQPPIYNGNAARFETCRLYYRRLFEKFEGFYLPDYAGAPKLPCWCHHHDDWTPNYDRVRITPGRGYFHALSRQSIPFYYPLAPNSESLQYYWDYRLSKTRTPDRHLSYHASDAPDSYSTRPEVIRPLYYSFDAYDFYRIEGHLARAVLPMLKDKNANLPDNSDIVAVPIVEALQFMVKRYNLDFDVREIPISCIATAKKLLTQTYAIKAPGPTPGSTVDAITATSFLEEILGAEHLAGVPKGGTFIVVTAQMTPDASSPKIIIADFSIPYRCCHTSSALDDTVQKLTLLEKGLSAQQLELDDVKAVVATKSDELDAMNVDYTEFKGKTNTSLGTLSNNITSTRDDLSKLQNTVTGANGLKPTVDSLKTVVDESKKKLDGVVGTDLPALRTTDATNAQSVIDLRSHSDEKDRVQDNKINTLRADVDKLMGGGKSAKKPPTEK